MNVIRYREWNWEFDYGIEEIPRDETPASFTDAFFDHSGRLYRAELHDGGFQCSYEYFSDDCGRVLEKRCYDEKGQLSVMVRISYNEEAGMATETAWSPEAAQPKRATVPISKYPWAQDA